MDLDLPPPPKFTAGQELATFLASSGILHQTWNEIHSVFTNNIDTFLLNEYEGVVYVTFPTLCIEYFMIRDSRYGECPIQNENSVFSACLKGDDDMPALVHKGALNRFLHILQSSDFKAQMERFLKQRKEQAIIIAGHSIGGAVATLATLWLLEKRMRHISPFCITFGSPLVGDARLGEAIGREDWWGNFCHVVSKYDIVPRMLLAPIESFAQPLNAIFPHRGWIMGNDSINLSHPSTQEACRGLLNNVFQCTSTIANDYPGESDLRSPYRPFGTYMFCSIYGAACIGDSVAVLKMLHFTMQRTQENEVADACISEHTSYGDMLEHITEYLVNTTRTANCVSDSSFEVEVALDLEALGAGSQNPHALLALRKAGEVKYEQDMNIEKLNDDLAKIQSFMAELEWYKGRCKIKGLGGYYDAFMLQAEKKDYHVNLARLRMADFWDDIIEKVKNHVLPSDFQCQNKWINAGTAYRRLVEPLDIAHYYHTWKDNKSYLSDGVRPQRHIILEKWMKEKDQTRTGRAKMSRTKFASLTQDSCFWARLEDASKALKNLKEEQERHQVMNAQLKESLEKFEEYVGNMIRDKSISAEVFWDQSSFMTWWDQYSQLQSLQWQSSSPLFKFMVNESWKFET